MKLLFEATLDTLYMSIIATTIAALLAVVPAILLVLCSPSGLKPNAVVYRVLDAITNTLRSFPFLILMVVLFPFTQWILGKSIGATAAIVPLSIGAAPFIVRIIESALKEVDKGVIEAAQSFGASHFQIIFKIMFVEALPSIVSGITLALILVIGFSAMAGAVGGGSGEPDRRYRQVRHPGIKAVSAPPAPMGRREQAAVCHVPAPALPLTITPERI